MAKKINTATFDAKELDLMQEEWVYNSLDCCVTSEVWDEMAKTVPECALPSYNFVRGMQAPALNMALRGIKIDLAKRNKWVREFEIRESKLQGFLDQMAKAVWDMGLNPRSSDQLKKFFYQVMRIPAEYKYDKIKKERVVSCDRNALEKIKVYFHARPFVLNILRMRDLSKKISTLKTGVDADGRMRTSYNVCGTETGRWSSNENAFGTGTNFQNWTDELREIFVADTGYKMGYIDGEQAESRVVAYMSGDANYIAACEGGDLHTAVAQMVWENLPWTGDAKADREIADQKFYRDMSYRDLAKRLGHGTNYRGKPRTMAMHTKVDVKIIEQFQDLYLNKAFPGISRWHHDLAHDLQVNGFLKTPIGRTRYFLGRLWDDDTLKEAIAFMPQSTIGEIINEGLYRVWEKFDREYDRPDSVPHVQCLAQVHDAILVQWPELGDEHEHKVIELLKKEMEIPVPINGRTLVIPANCEGTGWNWRKYHQTKNPQGLKKWTGNENRKRDAENTSVLSQFVL